MKTLIINNREVKKILPMKECIEIITETFKALERGGVIQPLRSAMKLANKRDLLGLMPGSLTNENVMGIKVISVFPMNYKKGISSHQGVILLFANENGNLLAIVDGEAVTAIRTAAVSAVATKALAREDSSEIAFLGAGVQARKHLHSISLVRDIKRARVWDISHQRAEDFAKKESKKYNISVKAVNTAQEAVKEADIICTVTSAKEPILKEEWVLPGAHINAVGACIPVARELDSGIVAKSKLYTDRRESLLNEAGDFLIPKKEGIIDDTHIQGELGEVLLGKIEGRKKAEDITLFESLGLAIEDLAVSNFIYKKARENDLGTLLEI